MRSVSRRDTLKILGSLGATATSYALLGQATVTQTATAQLGISAFAGAGAPVPTQGDAEFKAENGSPLEYSYNERRALARTHSGSNLYTLQLTDAEEERMLRVLVSQQSGLLNPARAMNPPPESEDQAAIAGAIGEERAAMYMRLQHYSPAFSLLGRLRESLEEFGAPLSETQVQQLRMRIWHDPAMAKPQHYDGTQAWCEARDGWWKGAQRAFCALRERVLTPLQLRVLQEEKELSHLFGHVETSCDEDDDAVSLEQRRAHRIPLSSEVSNANKRAFARRHTGWEAADLGLPDHLLDAFLVTVGSQWWRSLFREQPDDTDEHDIAEQVATIGADKAAEYNALCETSNARLDLKFMRRDLSRLGAPLSEAQLRELLRLAKQRRFLKDTAEESFAPYDQTKFTDAAKKALSAKQLRLLDEQTLLREAMRR